MLNRFYFEQETHRHNELAASCPKQTQDRFIQTQIENCESLFTIEIKRMGLRVPTDEQMAKITAFIDAHDFLDVRIPESYFVAYSELSSRGEFGGLQQFDPEISEAKVAPETVRQKISKLPKPPKYGGRKMGDENDKTITIVVRDTELPPDSKQREIHGHQENWDPKKGSFFGNRNFTGLTDDAARRAALKSREKRMTPEQKTAIDKGITTHGLPEGSK